jgi:hypothetical protein
MIFRRQFKHFEPRVKGIITQISDRDGFKNVDKWVEAFKNHRVIGRRHEFTGEIQAIKYAPEFTTMNLCTRLGALLYYDELEAASALPIIRNNTQKHYLFGSHAIKLAGVPVKGRSTSYTTRLYQTLGQVIQRGIGVYLFNVAKLLRRIDMEMEHKQESMKEFVEFELVIKPNSGTSGPSEGSSV